jgi:hypothetical protein
LQLQVLGLGDLGYDVLLMSSRLTW